MKDDIKQILSLWRFGATWCGPCKKMTPIVNKLLMENPDIEYHYIDIDKEPKKTKEFEIKAVPTLIFIKNGEEKERVVGLSLIDPLRKIVRENS